MRKGTVGKSKVLAIGVIVSRVQIKLHEKYPTEERDDPGVEDSEIVFL
jgi:hypothetical protein